MKRKAAVSLVGHTGGLVQFVSLAATMAGAAGMASLNGDPFNGTVSYLG